MTQTDPDDIHLYTTPWVGGTRADAYYGALSSDAFYDRKEDLEDAIVRAFTEVQKQCSLLGGNSIVGVEITIDPFASLPYVRIVGTGARLVPLFA